MLLPAVVRTQVLVGIFELVIIIGVSTLTDADRDWGSSGVGLLTLAASFDPPSVAIDTGRLNTPHRVPFNNGTLAAYST